MKIGKAITTFICVLFLFFFMGCNKTNEKNIVTDKNKYEPNTNSQKQSKEDTEEYKIKPNIIFYVLKDEYIENNDVKNPKASELIRVFICYDGVKNNIYPDTRVVMLDKVNTIEEFREKLLSDKASELKLPPKTIVSSEVLKQWEAQHYDGLSSYSDESPKGLTYSKIDFGVDEFSKEMKVKNYTFQLKDVSKDHFLPTTRKRMIIDKEVIDIYLYNSNKAMEKDAKGIYDGGYAYSNGTEAVNVSWGVSYTHFYKKGNIIVLYVGENNKIISDLKDIFGEQFQGKK